MTFEEDLTELKDYLIASGMKGNIIIVALDYYQEGIKYHKSKVREAIEKMFKDDEWVELVGSGLKQNILKELNL